MQRGVRRLRPLGWLTVAGTLGAMAATLVVAAPGGAAPGPEKKYEVDFEAACVLAPGVLDEKGTVKVHQVGEGPSTIEKGESFSLKHDRITIVTPKIWGETFFNAGSRSAKGFVKSTIVDVTNVSPTRTNIATPPEFPNGLPLNTKVEPREVEFTVPSENRSFVAGPYAVTGKAGEEAIGTVDTAPGFREKTAGHFESTGEGIQAEATGFNENGEANLGPVEVSCTAPANVVVADVPISGEGTSSSTTATESTATTESSTTTTESTTTTTTPHVLKVTLDDKLSGSLEVKKLANQQINLPEGCTFIGEGEIPGALAANTKCPPFSAPVVASTPLGPLSSLGLEFNESEPVRGTITPGEESKLLIRGTAKDNIRITRLGLLTASLATDCETNEPAVFPISAEATAPELVGKGASSSGETTLPPVHCSGLLGSVEGSLITTLMSGPGNHYQFTIAPS